MADDAPIYKSPSSPKKKAPSYDTKLSDKDEASYQAWVKEKGVRESDDYDMRGFWKDKGEQAENGHYPDTHKKPSHPTFSSESKYHGKDGHEGGDWKKVDGDKWTFTPGKTNIANGLDVTRDYLQNNDPDVTLVEPPAPPP